MSIVEQTYIESSRLADVAEASEGLAGPTLHALDVMFETTGPRDFAIRLWDGTEVPPEPGEPARCTIVLAHEGSLRRMIGLPAGLKLGEAYIYGDWDIEGDVEHVFELCQRLKASSWTASRLSRLIAAVLCLPATPPPLSGRRAAELDGTSHSKNRDAGAIHYHYDVGNDFYALWLDQDMIYSCAYFGQDDESLDSAQRRKLDYLCRKMRLEPGQRILDIGCGWGGLLRHAAREYGVTGVGITLSPSQADEARRRIQAEGLSSRMAVEVLDYRDARELGTFDAIVSVGMFEHVGRKQLPDYFAEAFDLLKPGGLFLNHGIAAAFSEKETWNNEFIEKYVFPDGELLPVSETLLSAEGAGFEVRDVESLREHYAQTLRHWVANLEHWHDVAVERTDEVTYRVWRLYMAGSAHAFKRGAISVFQSLLVKPTGDESGLPLTRADWYAD